MKAKSHKAVLTSLAIALVAAACADSPAEEHGPRANGAIVFAASPAPDYGPVQLYSMQPDGTHLQQLTDEVSFKTAVATSPDGSQIAYASSDRELTPDTPSPEPSSIFVMKADGSDRRELCDACARTAYTFPPELNTFEGDLYDETIDVVPNSLAWSPTDSMLAVPAVTPGVTLIDIETGTATTIPTPEPVTAIAWAPDGRRLALSHTWFQPEMVVPSEGTTLGDRYDRPPGGIYVVEVESGDITKTISTPGMSHVHGWSPDGDLIAFTRHFGTDEENEGNDVSVYSVSEDRYWPVVPAERFRWGLGAGWSPEGSRLAALIEAGGEDVRNAKDLLIASSDGTDLTTLPLCRFEGGVRR